MSQDLIPSAINSIANANLDIQTKQKEYLINAMSKNPNKQFFPLLEDALSIVNNLDSKSQDIYKKHSLVFQDIAIAFLDNNTALQGYFGMNPQILKILDPAIKSPKNAEAILHHFNKIIDYSKGNSQINIIEHTTGILQNALDPNNEIMKALQNQLSDSEIKSAYGAFLKHNIQQQIKNINFNESFYADILTNLVQFSTNNKNTKLLHEAITGINAISGAAKLDEHSNANIKKNVSTLISSFADSKEFNNIMKIDEVKSALDTKNTTSNSMYYIKQALYYMPLQNIITSMADSIASISCDTLQNVTSKDQSFKESQSEIVKIIGAHSLSIAKEVSCASIAKIASSSYEKLSSAQYAITNAITNSAKNFFSNAVCYISPLLSKNSSIQYHTHNKQDAVAKELPQTGSWSLKIMSEQQHTLLRTHITR